MPEDTVISMEWVRRAATASPMPNNDACAELAGLYMDGSERHRIPIDPDAAQALMTCAYTTYNHPATILSLAKFTNYDHQDDDSGTINDEAMKLALKAHYYYVADAALWLGNIIYLSIFSAPMCLFFYIGDQSRMQATAALTAMVATTSTSTAQQHHQQQPEQLHSTYDQLITTARRYYQCAYHLDTDDHDDDDTHVTAML